MDKLDVTVKDLQGVRADMRAVVLIWVWILGDPHIFRWFRSKSKQFWGPDFLTQNHLSWMHWGDSIGTIEWTLTSDLIRLVVLHRRWHPMKVSGHVSNIFTWVMICFSFLSKFFLFFSLGSFPCYLLHVAKISDLRAICCILEPKSLICVLFAAFWS